MSNQGSLDRSRGLALGWGRRVFVPIFVWGLMLAPIPLHAQVGDARVAAGKVDGTDVGVADSRESQAERDKRLREERELLRLFADTMAQIKTNYVKGNITDRELIEAAIKGMLTKTDQYSNYIDSSEIDRFRQEVESEFGGVGIQVSRQGDRLTIISPIYGTPAYEAGLMAGDVIVAIDGQPTQDMRLDDATKLLKGPLGSEVAITVLHVHEGSRETVKLKRETIRLQTVLGYRRKASDEWDYTFDAKHGIGYVRITSFSRHTAEELQQVLERLQAAGLQALILDLRFNPGGLLTAGVAVADLFVESGTIVSTSGRSIRPQQWTAKKAGTFTGFPMAVLVNRYSASASEIVSACLQDYDRAVVVGERTWGKGSVQNVIELEQGRSAIKLTTASYQRPSGKNIHRFDGATEEDEWGVQPAPEFRVRFSNRELRDFNRHLRQLDILRQAEEAEGGDDLFVDRQLDRAVEYLMGRIAPATEKGNSEGKSANEESTSEHDDSSSPKNASTSGRQDGT